MKFRLKNGTTMERVFRRKGIADCHSVYFLVNYMINGYFTFRMRKWYLNADIHYFKDSALRQKICLGIGKDLYALCRNKHFEHTIVSYYEKRL